MRGALKHYARIERRRAAGVMGEAGGIGIVLEEYQHRHREIIIVIKNKMNAGGRSAVMAAATARQAYCGQLAGSHSRSISVL